MLLKEFYQYITDRIKKAGSYDPQQEARIILSEFADLDWADIIARGEEVFDLAKYPEIAAVLDRRCENGEPISRILGWREFWGMRFDLNESTLDPRPDTEVLVERALAYVKKTQMEAPRILDLGTGTGCILLSLLKELPEASGIGVDLSNQALEAARGNAVRNGLSERSTFVQSDWFQNVEGKFDLIVSNPPYIDSDEVTNLDENVQKFDPILALEGGDLGLEPYKNIFFHLYSFLKKDGRAFFEIGFDQCGYIQGIAEDYRIRLEEIYPDYAGIPRVVEISCGDKSKKS